MKSLEKSCRCEGSVYRDRRGMPTPQPPSGSLSGCLSRSPARYRSASDSPKLMASVSGLSPSKESDSVMLAMVGESIFGAVSSVGDSGIRAMLVLTTGRSAGAASGAGGEARREGDGARLHSEGGVPGEGPGTADCYGHCWKSGARFVKQ